MKDGRKEHVYPVNPQARFMSYENRIKRYNQEKDKMFLENRHLPASELQEKHERLLRWWDV